MTSHSPTNNVLVKYTYPDSTKQLKTLQWTHSMPIALCTPRRPPWLDQQRLNWNNATDSEHVLQLLDEKPETCFTHCAPSTKGIAFLTNNTLLVPEAEIPIVHNWVLPICEKGSDCEGVAVNAMHAERDSKGKGKGTIDEETYLAVIEKLRGGVNFPDAGRWVGAGGVVMMKRAP